jgi:hypothetical protein
MIVAIVDSNVVELEERRKRRAFIWLVRGGGSHCRNAMHSQRLLVLMETAKRLHIQQQTTTTNKEVRSAGVKEIKVKQDVFNHRQSIEKS